MVRRNGFCFKLQFHVACSCSVRVVCCFALVCGLSQAVSRASRLCSDLHFRAVCTLQVRLGPDLLREVHESLPSGMLGSTRLQTALNKVTGGLVPGDRSFVRKIFWISRRPFGANRGDFTVSHRAGWISTGRVRPGLAPRGPRVIAELNVGVYTLSKGPQQGDRKPYARSTGGSRNLLGFAVKWRAQSFIAPKREHTLPED